MGPVRVTSLCQWVGAAPLPPPLLGQVRDGSSATVCFEVRLQKHSETESRKECVSVANMVSLSLDMPSIHTKM